MKKIQVVFAAAAILLSAAGVFANTHFADIYYRTATPMASGDLGSGLTADCSVAVVITPCTETVLHQCIKNLPYPIPGNPNNTADFRVSKRIDGTGDCIAIKRQS